MPRETSYNYIHMMHAKDVLVVHENQFKNKNKNCVMLYCVKMGEW